MIFCLRAIKPNANQYWVSLAIYLLLKFGLLRLMLVLLQSNSLISSPTKKKKKKSRSWFLDGFRAGGTNIKHCWFSYCCLYLLKRFSVCMASGNGSLHYIRKTMDAPHSWYKTISAILKTKFAWENLRLGIQII